MFRSFVRALLAALLFLSLLLLPAGVLAVSVGTVTVSPSVVPVPTSAARQTAVLISATVAGLAQGSTVSCTVTLTLLPSGTVLATSPAVSTSPAPASGTSSMSVQMMIPGLTPSGPAQAAVNCGPAVGAAQFRISSLVGLIVVPRSVPAGGTSTMTVMIAAGGPLAATLCTLIVTDASGSSPPLLTQTVSVSGGTATVPASAAVSVNLPQTAVLGTANASVSCLVAGFGTSGDSVDFTVTDPTVVTVLGLSTPAVAGAALTVTSVTLPGFSCVALFNPPAGARIASVPALADATGTVVNTVLLPLGIQPGTGSVTVVCTDPSNPANTASSAPEAVTLVSSAALSVPAAPSVSAALSVSASLVSTPQPLAPAGLVTIGVLTSPGASCAVVSVIGSLGSSPVTEASRAGVAGANGSLTLAFHLPAGVVSGTAVATIGCSGGGAQATAQVPVLVGNSPAPINCAGLGGGSAPASAAPIADAGSSYVASAGQPVQFIGAGSAPSTGAVLTTCVRNFSDDSRATTLNPVHTFGAAGVFTVSLTVNDSAGLSATATAVARIGPYLPLCSQPSLTGTVALGVCVAALTCASTSLPTQCLPPCSTLLPAAVSSGSPCPQPSTSVQVNTGGPYSVAVSQSITFQGSVTVVGTRRLCSADATLGTGGPYCRLAPAVDLPVAVAYTWDFGDGTNATGSSTGHAYGQAGTYVVTLTIGFDDGSKANASTVAQVSSLTPAATTTTAESPR